MADKIICVPDAAFFAKTLEAPSGLSEKDLGDFVRTAVENMSPLPPDALCHGFFRRANKVFVFTGSKTRALAGAESNSGTALLIPSAMCFLSTELPDGLFVFDTKKSLALVEIKNGFWTNFCAVERGDDFEKARKNLGAMFGSDIPAQTPVYELKSAEARGRKKFSFSAEEKGSGKTLFWEASRAELKNCDLRGESELSDSKKRKTKETLTKIGIALIPAAFVILAIWQLAVLARGFSVASISERLAALEPEAKLVVAQSEQIAELTAFTKEKLHPVFLLAVANSLRPDDISFSRASASSPSEIEIQGKAPSIGRAMEYASALRNDPRIGEVKSKTESRGEARFTLNIKFGRK